MTEVGDDDCHYPKCGAKLGEWKPDYYEQVGTCESRICDKCGGKQVRWVIKDAETLEAVDTLFKEMK